MKKEAEVLKISIMAKNKEEIKFISKKDSEELSKTGNGGGIILSLYMGINSRDGARYNFSSEANSVIAGVAVKIKNSPEYSEGQKKQIIKAISEVKEKIKFFRVPQGARGVAMFFGSGKRAKIFFLSVRTPSCLIVGSDPYINFLVKAMEKFPQYLVVAVERDRAEFFPVFLGKIEGEPEIILSDVPKKIRTSASDDWHGRREKRIERHIEDHLNRHFKTVAAKIKDYFRKNKFDHLIVGGHGELTARFIGFLDKRSKDKLIGCFSLAHSDHGEIKGKSIEIVNRHEKEMEKEIADSLIGGINTKKWTAVAGTDSVIKNILRRNARVLVIGINYRETGYVCPVCHYISSSEKKCPICGNKMQISGDLADKIIEEAIRKNIEIRHLFYPHKEFDKFGIGAFLNSPMR